MIKVFTFLVLLLVISVLSACDIEESVPEGLRISTPNPPPTPTLAAGLPSPTADSEQPQRDQDSGDIQVTPTDLPTVGPSPVATDTPAPAARLGLGKASLLMEDYDSAADHLLNALQSDSLTEDEHMEALYGLGIAQRARGFDQAAVDAFSELLSSSASVSSGGVSNFQSEVVGQVRFVPTSYAYYNLARIYEERGDCEAAVQSYDKFLDVNPELGPYILPEQAACYVILGDPFSATQNYETAVTLPSLTGINTSLRLELARQYLSTDDYEGALEQYEKVGEQVSSEQELGRANYLIGSTHLALGSYDEGYDYYRKAVESYPNSFESYLALSALLEIGENVDDYDRGIVDYYADAYEPAIAALSRYLDGSNEHDEEAHLYLAWSYEGLGANDAAFGQIDAYIKASASEIITSTNSSPFNGSNALTGDPSRGWVERAKLQARSGNLVGAIEDYQNLLANYPTAVQAPLAAWWSAAYAERIGNYDQAIAGYRFLADNYPDHVDAAEALFRAGYLAWNQGYVAKAIEHWQLGAESYSSVPYGAASLIWLMRAAEDENSPILELAEDISGTDYYQFRVQHIAQEIPPFEFAEAVTLGVSSRERDKANDWVRQQLELTRNIDVASLDAELALDGRLVRGTKLWQLGRRLEAKRELEDLRLNHRNGLLASYQLSIYFQELGLYRSAILAALDVMRLSNVSVIDAPTFIGKLAYPDNYSDLVETEAQKYGFDPLLQFALIRQESLFESFAKSYAAAQGLSQVIPDTGVYIAERLNWPDYQNADLYKPYVGIAFGAYYLNQQLDAFDGDVAAALSAYNGGPGNAARWYEQAGHDIDLYREIVDFGETREYIDRIYEGHTIYRYLYGR